MTLKQKLKSTPILALHRIGYKYILNTKSDAHFYKNNRTMISFLLGIGVEAWPERNRIIPKPKKNA